MNIKKVTIIFVIISLTIITAGLNAQEFGFGFDDEEEAGTDETVAGAMLPSKRESPVKVSGDITVEFAPYVHDFDEENGAQAISYRDVVSGSLKLSASAGNVDAYAAFNLNADAVSELWDVSPSLSDPSYTPLIMDEAYLRGFIGPVTIEAGLRKLSWGKADSLGPLDVINPLDYSDLRNISDIQAIKIARPMLHVTWNPGGFSKLETVFIPNFAGHRFAQDGRWAASQFTDMADMVEKEIMSGLSPYMAMIPPAFLPIMGSMSSQFADSFSPEFPDTSGLNYFQTGLRFTTTVGPADIGAQYFYGNLFQPDVVFPSVNVFIDDLISKNIPLFMGGGTPDPSAVYTGNPALLSPQIKYNRYHQLGVDYAQVLFGFNVRAEFAVHLTEDLKGDDGSVRNPFIG
ncbi:MAG: hypothetical protein FWF55_05820, partial [Treponema sp.]|nr:hypothetical protein [Treponema sp.]